MEEMIGERIQRIVQEQFVGTPASPLGLRKIAHNVQQAYS